MNSYRAYKNAEEFLQAWKEHGPFFKIVKKYDNRNLAGYCSVSSFFDYRVSFFASEVNEEKRTFYVNSKGLSYDELLDYATWSDGTPCGIKEDKSNII